jgi:hypothetical protein
MLLRSKHFCAGPPTCCVNRATIKEDKSGTCVASMLNILIKNLKGRQHSEEKYVDWRTVLWWILRKYNIRMLTALTPVPCFCKHDNETLGFIKCHEINVQVRYYYVQFYERS